MTDFGKVAALKPIRNEDNGRSYRLVPSIIFGKARECASYPPVEQTSLSRKYLTPDTVERMIIAARQAGGRLAEHDALLIMMAWRTGFRASELIALRRDQIDLKARTQHVARLRNGPADLFLARTLIDSNFTG
jgi:integrase